jgi:hypothetical protein
MYNFISQVYGGVENENLGGDAEGKAVAGKVSFLSEWSGQGDREYRSGGCGRWREQLGSRIILCRWG